MRNKCLLITINFKLLFINTSFLLGKMMSSIIMKKTAGITPKNQRIKNPKLCVYTGTYKLCNLYTYADNADSLVLYSKIIKYLSMNQ